MFLRRNLRLPRPGWAWLVLSVGGLIGQPLIAMDKEPMAGKGDCGSERRERPSPHPGAPEPGGPPPGQVPLPPGFEQWLQELKAAAARPGRSPMPPMPQARLVADGAMLRTFIPSPGAKAHFFKPTHGQTHLNAAETLFKALGDRPLHPFFVVRGDERTGKVSRLYLSSGPGRIEQPPRELSVGPDNDMAWVCDSGSGCQVLTPVGSHHGVINAQRRIRHCLIAGDRTWDLGRAWVGTGTNSGQVVIQDLASPLEKGSGQPVASERGDLFVPMPRDVLHLHPQDAGPGRNPAIIANLIPGTEETRNARLMTNRAGTVLVHARPDQPFLYARGVGDEVGARIETASGGFPVCLAQGAGADIWFIQTNPFGFGCMDTRTRQVVHLLPEGQAEEVQEPHAAALGPDGNLWFTDRAGCRIGRITRRDQPGGPVGHVTLFDLGKGQQPEEIVSSAGAWLFFTVKDQAVINSIRAVDARPEEACEDFIPGQAVEAPETAAGEAAPPKRRFSGAQRRKRRQEQERAAQGTLPQPHQPEPPQAASEESRAVLPPAVESKACAPAPPAPAGQARIAPGRRGSAPAPARPRPAQERLKAMHVQVDDDNLRKHILNKHGEESKANASKFARPYSTPEGLLALLADSLAGAEIGRELRVDRVGNFYTTCRQAGVGQCNGQETDTFTVVTRMQRNGRTREWWHVLVTAFPGQ